MNETGFALTGACQCGKTRYVCTAPPFVAYTCHCRDCQRLTGSAFAACMQVPAEALDIKLDRLESQTRVADDGNQLTTYFCPFCSSPLFTANSARPRLRTVYVGTLDHPDSVDVDAHIWTSRALPWFVFPEGHRVFPEGGDWRSDYASDPDRLRK